MHASARRRKFHPRHVLDVRGEHDQKMPERVLQVARCGRHGNAGRRGGRSTVITAATARSANASVPHVDMEAAPAGRLFSGPRNPISGHSSDSMMGAAPIVTSACMILPPGPSIRMVSTAPNACL